MSTMKYSRTRSKEVAWTFKEERHELGTPFHSVWSREMINLNPNVWEIKLTSNQVVPPHLFNAQTVQIFTSGSVAIEGEGECGEGDVRWALKDYDYNQEEMGPNGTTLIGIQQGPFEADWTE